MDASVDLSAADALENDASPNEAGRPLPPPIKAAGPIAPTPGWSPSSCDKIVGTGETYERIQAAIDAASPGDTICVKNGTYHETLEIDKDDLHIVGQDCRSTVIDGEFELPAGFWGIGQGPRPKDGTPCSEDQDAAKGPAYDHACSVFEGLVDISGNDTTFEGFKLFRSRGRGIRIWRCDTKDQRCIVRNTTLRNLRIDYTRKTSIYFRIASGGSVERCDLSRGSSHTEYQRSSQELNHGASGIGFQGVSDMVVAGTIVHQGWGETLIADGTDLGSENLTVQDNVFFDNWRGLYFHGLRNALLQRNLFYNSVESNQDDLHSSPFAVTKSEPNFVNQGASENIIIINNIVASDNDVPRIASGAVPRGVVGVHVYNNLFFSRNSGGGSLAIGANIEAINLANNIFYHDGGKSTVEPIVSSTEVKTTASNCFSDSAVAGLEGPGDIYSCEPQFVGSDGSGTIPPLQRGQVRAEWFQLAPTSPLIDRGTDLAVQSITWNDRDSYVTDDYFTGPRPHGKAFDVGACEYGNALAAHPQTTEP